MPTTKAEASKTVNPEENKLRFEVVDTTEAIPVKLGHIITLMSTGIPGADDATRKIDKKHLQSLLTVTDVNLIPPIILQPSNKGMILVDGNHRNQRVIYLALYEYNKKKGIWPRDEKNKFLPPDIDVIEEFLTVRPTGKTPYQRTFTSEEQEFINNQTILATFTRYSDADDLIDHAFKANLNHGMGASDKHRSRYGCWLLDRAERKGLRLSMRDAAAIAGVSASAVSQYRTNKARLKEKATDAAQKTINTVHAEKAAEKAAQQADDPSIIADKAIKALVKPMREFYSLFKDSSRQETALFVSSYFTNEDMAMLSGLAEVFKEVPAVIQAINTGTVKTSEEILETVNKQSSGK